MPSLASRLVRTLRLVPLFCGLAIASIGEAATSYMMIRGPFGAAGSTETHQFRFEYTGSQVVNGLSLLSTLFGTPVDAGTLYEGNPYFTANGGILGTENSAAYVNYGTAMAPYLFIASLKLHNVEVDPPPYDWGAPFNPAWIYYTSPNSSTAWAESWVGAAERTLTDGSFDAWVYGGFDSAGLSVSDVNTVPPSSASFGSLTNLLYSGGGLSVYGVAAAVPEPGRMLLLGVGGVALVFRRRRKLPLA